MTRIGVIALVALCGVLAGPTPVLAQASATYQVDPALGDDGTGTGSATAPFRTITRALAAARPGETALLRPGTTPRATTSSTT